MTTPPYALAGTKRKEKKKAARVAKLCKKYWIFKHKQHTQTFVYDISLEKSEEGLEPPGKQVSAVITKRISMDAPWREFTRTHTRELATFRESADTLQSVFANWCLGNWYHTSSDDRHNAKFASWYTSPDDGHNAEPPSKDPSGTPPRRIQTPPTRAIAAQAGEEVEEGVEGALVITPFEQVAALVHTHTHTHTHT